MKKWKEIIHNCPYMIALIATWLFFTIGGGVLLWYRGYEGSDWQELCKNPVFAVAVTAEMQGQMTETTMALNDKETVVIVENQYDSDFEKNKIEEKLNANIINPNPTSPDAPDGECEEAESFDNATFALFEAQDLGQPQEGLQLDWTLIEAAKALENQSGQFSGDIWDGSGVAGIDAALSGTDGLLEDEEMASEGSTDAEEDSFVSGETRFETYEPIETDSIYYSDAGKIAYTTDYEYRKVTENYFTDAAFLGDSRTLGISDYAGLEADFYCESGMTIYKLFDDKGIVYQKSGQKVNLSQVMQQKQYGKIYIMLGMNELGYGDTEKYLNQYEVVIDRIRELQPQAVIFVMANLHVSEAKNNMETEFNNVNINDKNAAAATLADGTDIFYLDSNPLFVDNNGFLKEDLTFDGVHLYANNYEAWKEFLMEHGVVKDDKGRTGNSTK